MRSAGVHGGGSIMPLGLPFYLWPGSSWFAMSLTVDVFAYTLAGTLAVVDAVTFGQRQTFIWSHLSLSGIHYCPRELFCLSIDRLFFPPPFVFFSGRAWSLSSYVGGSLFIGRLSYRCGRHRRGGFQQPSARVASRAMSDHWDCHLTALRVGAGWRSVACRSVGLSHHEEMDSRSVYGAFSAASG